VVTFACRHSAGHQHGSRPGAVAEALVLDRLCRRPLGAIAARHHWPPSQCDRNARGNELIGGAHLNATTVAIGK